MERPTAIKFNYPAFIPPGMLRDLQTCPKGNVQREDAIEYMGFTLESPVPLIIGKEYELQCGSHNILFYYTEDKEAYANHMRQLREEKERLLELFLAQKSNEFWNRYAIPFNFDIDIKERLSGLSISSYGNGRARNTVYHLFLKEDYTDESLTRKAGNFLCSPVKSRYGGDWSGSLGSGDTTKDTFGNQRVVTCKACLRLMERFKTKSPQNH